MGIEPGFELLGRLYELGEQEEVLDRYLPLWNRLLETELELMPGARSILRMFSDAAIPTALVTSGDAEYANLVTTRLGLQSLFRCVITSDQVQRLKPSPDPYLTAANCLQTPSACVVAFEDSGSSVASVVAAGMYCVAVNRDVHTRQELAAAQMRITSLKKFQASNMMSMFGTSAG